jgi:hypothetical protein
MKAFSSIRREFKALYKPRASDNKGKESETPLELANSSRPWTAPSGGSYVSDFANTDIQASAAKDSEDLQHGQSPRNSAEAVAATVNDILASDRAPRHFSEQEVSTSPIDVADVELPKSPANDDQHDQHDQDAANGEATFEPQDEQEPVQELTAEEAQAIRDQTYITFESEDAEDYTQGPVRFVLATDGVQDCVVLLMTMDLSVRIQSALRMQHAFEQAERAGLRQRQTYMRFEKKVKAEIANCRAKIANVRDVDAEKEEELQNQLEILELLLDDVQSRRQTVHVHLETQGEELRDVQAAANALIEEAYIYAGLAQENQEEHDSVSQDLDLETEYAAFVDKLKNANDLDMVAVAPPLDTSRDYDDEVLAPTEEEKARQEIINTLWASKEALEQARRDFEEREITRAREFQANKAAADRGEPTTDATPDDFDVRWVLRYAELTRDLINAEAAYADVKRTAFEAGVPLPFEDNETVCEAMDEDDGVGYTISKEQELVASVPSPTVRRWLDKVPEGGEVGSPSFGDGVRSGSESDEWEAEEVGISDSVSLVAEGRERARIDRWRKACVGEKQE